MFGIELFFVGAVLWVNGMVLLQKSDIKGGVPINLFVGLLTLFVNIYFIIVKPFGEQLSLYYAATGLLFPCTYLWNAMNGYFGFDGRALGWFCQFVAFSALPTAYIAFQSDWRFGAFWLAWGALWYMFHMILNLGFAGPRFVKATGYYTLAVAVVTCWVPGYLILINKF